MVPEAVREGRRLIGVDRVWTSLGGIPASIRPGLRKRTIEAKSSRLFSSGVPVIPKITCGG